jgi:hypothetical protein
MLANWHGRGPAILFSSGRSDHALKIMEPLYARAVSDGLDAVLKAFPGGHTFHEWRDSFEYALPWFMDHFMHPARTPGVPTHRHSFTRGGPRSSAPARRTTAA